MRTKRYELVAFKIEENGEKNYMRLGELHNLALTDEEYVFLRRIFHKNEILLLGIEDEYIDTHMKIKEKLPRTRKPRTK